jgi:hypothetical protein
VATIGLGNRRETIVVFGDEQGVVHVVDAATCQELPGWPQQMALPPGSPPGSHAVIEPTPAIGWLDGSDRPPSIIVGAGSTWENTGVCEVEAFYLSGYERWARYVHPTPGNANGVFSSPAVGDVGGGGQQDVVFGSWDYDLYVVSSAGEKLPGTPYYNTETIWSSPALFEMPGQQSDDIFIGLDKSQTLKADGCLGGLVTDLRYGFVPHSTARGLYVVHQSPCQGAPPGGRQGQAVWSSPAVGYLAPPAHLPLGSLSETHTQPESPEPVVAIGTSWNDQPFGYGTNGLYVYDALTMQLLWKGTTPGPVFGSPAIGLLASGASGSLPGRAGVASSFAARPAIVDTSFVCTDPIAQDRLADCLDTKVSEVDAWSGDGRLLWQTRLIGPSDLGSRCSCRCSARTTTTCSSARPTASIP